MVVVVVVEEEDHLLKEVVVVVVEHHLMCRMFETADRRGHPVPGARSPSRPELGRAGEWPQSAPTAALPPPRSLPARAAPPATASS